jgi:hypothetical protein
MAWLSRLPREADRDERGELDRVDDEREVVDREDDARFFLAMPWTSWSGFS